MKEFPLKHTGCFATATALCLLALGAAAESASAIALHGRIPVRIEMLDWNRSPTTSDSIVLNSIMEGLFEFDAHLGIRPVLAQSHAISADGKTYTFKIKPGVKWSDGRLLSAQDFADSWHRIIEPGLGSPYSSFFDNIVGARDYAHGKNHDFSTVGIRVTDPATLMVELRSPCAYFPQMLTLWATFPIRADLVEKYGLNSWTDPAKLVTLGPYKLISTQGHSRYVLKPNPLYHDAGRTRTFDSIDIEVDSDEERSLKNFKAGTLDFVLNPLRGRELVLPTTGAFHSVPLLRTRYLAVNTNQYPLSLPVFRRALAMAIDVSKLPGIIHRSSTAASSFVPTDVLAASKDTGVAYDPAGAKKLLVETGISASSVRPIELVGIDDEETTLLLNHVKEQLRTNLGLACEVQMVPVGTYRSRIGTSTGGVFAAGWGADYADPDSFLAVFLSDSPANALKWKSARYDELVTKGAFVPNGAPRQAIYLEALGILQRTETAIIPMYYQRTDYLLDPRISGIDIDPLGVVRFRNPGAK